MIETGEHRKPIKERMICSEVCDASAGLVRLVAWLLADVLVGARAN